MVAICTLLGNLIKQFTLKTFEYVDGGFDGVDICIFNARVNYFFIHKRLILKDKKQN